MWTRRVIGIAFGIALVALSFVPIFSQGSLSDQVLRLLDRQNTWTKTQIIAANYGLQLNDGAPTVTTNKLYQQASTLYWNGSVVGSGGGGSSNWTLVGGTTLVPLTIANRVRVGTSGTATEAFYVDGTMRVTGATTFNSTVATGALTPASVGVTGAATVGTTLNVTGASTLASLGVTGAQTIGTTLNVSGASTLASVGVTGAATVGTTLQVTGASTLASVGVTSAATVGTTLGVTGVATLSSGAILGTNTGTTAGTIRYNGSNFAGYNGSGWVLLDASAATAGGWTENVGTNTVHLATGTRKVSIGAGITAPVFLSVLGTTEQVRIAYDATNYFKTEVASDGVTTLTSVSSTAAAAIRLSSPVTVKDSALSVDRTGEQLRLNYNATNYLKFEVDSVGVATMTGVSATAAQALRIVAPVTIKDSALSVDRTTGEQLRLNYDATHYLSFEVASTGIVSLSSVSGAGVASFSLNAPVALGAAAVGELRFREPSGTGTDYVGFKAPASIATSLVWTLPAADGTVGQVLITSGAGVLSWAANAASGMSNPMTTTGDLIYAADTAAPSTPARRAIGTTGQCLVVAGGLPAWGSCAAGASVAGSDTQVQYNNAGAFGANGAFTYTAATATLGLVGATTGARLGLQLRNTGAGAADTIALQLGNDIGADTLSLKLNSSLFAGAYHTATINNKLGPLVLKATDTTAMTLINTGVTISGTLAVAGTLGVTGASTFAGDLTLIKSAVTYLTTETYSLPMTILKGYTGDTRGTGRLGFYGMTAFLSNNMPYTGSAWSYDNINYPSGQFMIQAGDFFFNTRPDSSSTITSRFFVHHDGNVRVGPSNQAPNNLLTLGLAGTTGGVLAFEGSSSGVIVIRAAAVAGTYTLTLPTDAGVAGQLLTTDGAGVLTWSGGGGGGGGTPVAITVANESINTVSYPLFVNSATGDLGPKTNVGLKYDAADQALYVQKIKMIALSDPGDVRLANTDGLYNTSGHIGFAGYIAGSPVRAYYGAIQGIQGDTVACAVVEPTLGCPQGLLILAASPGVAGTTRQMLNGEDASFTHVSDGGVYKNVGGSTYEQNELVPHVALHGNGMFEIGFLTNATVASGLDPQFLVRGGKVQFTKYGAGTATFDANGKISSVSDERLKTSLRPLPYGLAEVLALDPIAFHFTKASGYDTKHEYGGFGAAQVELSMPIAVAYNAEGYRSLSDSVIIAASVNAIKELHAQIASLEARVAHLEARH